MILSIIDLGSNSARMDIAEINEATGNYRYLARERRLVRLSEGMSLSGGLAPESVDRTIAALREFKAQIDEYGCDDVIAVATAAVRNADNKDEFLADVKRETGIDIRVIKGEHEAEYDFLGVIGSLDTEECVITDTGGGSTEFILLSGGEALARTSIPVGAVNMTERFFSLGESREAFEALSDYVRSQLDKIHWLDDALGLPVVGMGGSVYNLAVVAQNRPGADRGALHGCEISSGDAVSAFEALAEMSENERLGAGIEKGREDTIIAGLMPNICLLDKLGSDRLIICSAGLKEGILYEFLENI